MRIASAQINPRLGDFNFNADKILSYTKRAKEKKCDLVVFPELSLFGYWPGDLLERTSIVQEQIRKIDWLEKRVPEGISIIIGAVTENTKKEGKLYFNSAVLLTKNKKRRLFHKELLPTYDVFDEDRYFERGNMEKNVFTFKGKKILVTICEDIWASGDAWVGTRFPKNPLLRLKKNKPDLILNLSASPFSIGKVARRNAVIEKACSILKAPLLYTNMVGGQDEVIFDGGSTFINRKSDVQMQSVYFEEDLNVVDVDTGVGGNREVSTREVERIRSSLVIGIRDFCEKVGLERVHLGLSGGIDSAVVACLAVDALGPLNVHLIAMPGPHSADESFDLAKALSENLGANFHDFPIRDAYKMFEVEVLNRIGSNNSITFENLQARLRAVALMSFSNEKSSLLLSTSNKSELAVGYSTLYGDQCGGLMPLGDLVKGRVYELAKLYNSDHELIPERIITRPPTAELRPNQKDEDSLPPYPELDAAVKRIVEECKPARSQIEKWLINRLYQSEFKRWQAPPILRVTSHAFGRGRRYPIAHMAGK